MQKDWKTNYPTGEEDPIAVIKRCIDTLNANQRPSNKERLERFAEQYSGVDITNGYRISEVGGKLILLNSNGEIIT